MCSCLDGSTLHLHFRFCTNEEKSTTFFSSCTVIRAKIFTFYCLYLLTLRILFRTMLEHLHKYISLLRKASAINTCTNHPLQEIWNRHISGYQHFSRAKPQYFVFIFLKQGNYFINEPGKALLVCYTAINHPDEWMQMCQSFMLDRRQFINKISYLLI